jgi:O-succinylbenzoic acid--CoA ligase
MIKKSSRNFFSFRLSKDLTAVANYKEQLTYKKLFIDSNHLASALSKLGIKKKGYIPILLEDGTSFIKATISLWMIGAVPVPLNTKYLDSEIESILDNYNFKFLISDKEIFLGKSAKEITVIKYNEIKLTKDKLDFQSPKLNNESVVIFTSGSTGFPKGVVHTFKSLINQIEKSQIVLNQKKNDRWIASLPFYHIGGFQIICRSLLYGCSIIIPKSLSFENLGESISRLKPTHISLVSAQLDKLINQKIAAPKSIKVSLIGGGFVEDDLIHQSAKIGWKPIRVYGSSETASLITSINNKEIKLKPESSGKPLEGVKIRINKDSEILIKSSGLFKEYLFDKKETELKKKNGFYYSGDLGFLDKDGYLFVEARRNDLIVSGGENVNPIEVEKVLKSFDFIKEACVFPKPNKIWGQIVAAVVVSKDSKIDEKYLREKLKQKLAGFKVPKEIIFTKNLPKTALGKLAREKIKRAY